MGDFLAKKDDSLEGIEEFEILRPTPFEVKVREVLLYLKIY